jgi:CheY-like chemotaxis protein
MSQEAIMKANRAVSSGPKSVGTLAHDINNLLGVVVTNLDLLCEQLADTPGPAALAADIVEAALRASELSRSLIGTGSEIPAARPAPPIVDAPASPTATARPGSAPVTILVVDDNPELRRAVVRQLLDLGYGAIEAGDGPAALMILNSEPVDLLFTDVVMPGGMSGFDLARLVLARWPAMKAVITSGFPELEPIGDSITAGKLRRLTKPYRRGELAQTLSEVLDAELGAAAIASPQP